MADVIAIIVGRCFYPFSCDTCCATNFVHMWQMENHLRVVKPLLFGKYYYQCGRWKATMMNGRCWLSIVADGIST